MGHVNQTISKMPWISRKIQHVQNSTMDFVVMSLVGPIKAYGKNVDERGKTSALKHRHFDKR
jgi:hypothetical protein